jgi:hypothetical protein
VSNRLITKDLTDYGLERMTTDMDRMRRRQRGSMEAPKKFSVTLDEPQYERLKNLALSRGRSMASEIDQMLDSWFEESAENSRPPERGPQRRASRS